MSTLAHMADGGESRDSEMGGRFHGKKVGNLLAGCLSDLYESEWVAAAESRERRCGLAITVYINRRSLPLLTGMPVRRTIQPARFLRLCPISGVRAETSPPMRGECKGHRSGAVRIELTVDLRSCTWALSAWLTPAKECTYREPAIENKIHGARESARKRVKEVCYSSLLGGLWQVPDHRRHRPAAVDRVQGAHSSQRWMAPPARALRWAASSTWIARRASGRDTSGAASPSRAWRQLA